MIRIRLLLPMLAGLAGCTSREPAPSVQVSDEEILGVAKAAAQEAFERLSAELGAAMAEGGPSHAIPVCSSKAGSVVDTVATEHGVAMRRLSDRPRNLSQRAEGEDLAALIAFRESMGAGEAPKPRIERHPDSAVVRLPIVIHNPLCLQCHGGAEEVVEEARRELSRLYPADEATGYTLDELRGIWRIEVPASAVEDE